MSAYCHGKTLIGCDGCGKVNNNENPNRLKGVYYKEKLVAMCADCMPKYNAYHNTALLLVLLEELGLEGQIDYETIEMCHAFAPYLEWPHLKNKKA